MKAFNALIPTKLVVGAGRLSEVGSEMAELGTKVFGVFDPFLRGSETTKKIRGWLEEKDLELIEFYDVVPNPRYTDMDKGRDICVANGCDCILAVGGGSAIDTAKAITLSAVYGGSSWDYTTRHYEPEKVRSPKKRGLPLLAIPTTAGTGTEATLCSVVNNPDIHVKCTIINPVIFPNTSIIDPEIMYSVPPKTTAFTGLDTFAHAFESYIVASANEFSEMLSLKSIELCAKHLRTAVHEPKNEDARAGMALASALAGAAFCQCGLCLPHAMGQPVGGLKDAPHGATVAICLPAILEWTLPYAQEKIARVAALFDPAVAGLPVNEQANAIIPVLKKLYEDIGATETYKDYGVTEEDIPTLVNMVYDYYAQDAAGHPKPVTREDVAMLFKNSL